MTATTKPRKDAGCLADLQGVYNETPWFWRFLNIGNDRDNYLKLKLIYFRQSVDQSVLVWGTDLGPTTNFSFSLIFPLHSWGFVILWRPLWREDRSIIYCTIASGRFQSSHSWVKVPLNSRPYFTFSFQTPPTWRVRSPYLYPPGTGWPSYTLGHWVPFLSPLTTAGQRWWYSNPPPYGSDY
jgi:hypothetical protein